MPSKKKVRKPSKRMQQRVDAGAAFLNVVNPGWEKRIDIERLDLGNPNVCMLGELYGNYSDGKDMLGIETDAAIALGFESESAREYPILTQTWIQKIKSLFTRRKKVTH